MALVPAKTWINNTAPPLPSNVSQNNNVISWTTSANARYYVVYRVTSATPGSGNAATVIQDASKIVARVWNTDAATLTFTDTGVSNPGRYRYIVTAVNGAHVESAPVIATK